MLDRVRMMARLPEQSLVYHIENYRCTGSSTTTIDTELKLFNTTDFPNGFRVEFVGKITKIPSDTWSAWIACKDESGDPYPGFFIAQSSSSNGITGIWFDVNAGEGKNITEKSTVGKTISCSILYDRASAQLVINGNTTTAGIVLPNDQHLTIGFQYDGNGNKMRYGYVEIDLLNVYKLNHRSDVEVYDYLPYYSLGVNEYIPLGVINPKGTYSYNVPLGQIIIYFANDYDIRGINGSAMITDDTNGDIYSYKYSSYEYDVTRNGSSLGYNAAGGSTTNNYLSMLQLPSGDAYNNAVWMYDKFGNYIYKHYYYGGSGQPYHFESNSYLIGGRRNNSAQMKIVAIGIASNSGVNKYLPAMINNEVWFVCPGISQKYRVERV